MKSNLLRTSLALLLLASIHARLAAQPAASAAKEDILELDPFKVTSDVAVDQLVLPIARPFNSVFGTDDNIVNVPRNVTIISRQQLSDINISSVLDFSKLTSSAYTTTNFGAPSNPSIRGQIADLFINGMRGRITSNGNGLPMDFNAIESVNIVKGPGTAVQGTSMYVGGFIDLITKRPYFDKDKGSVSVTVGSYSQKEWTFDVGGPIKKDVAYRISYSGEDSHGYWHDYYNKNNSLYGALEFRPTENYDLLLTGSWADFRYTENWGINRVTQDLIDHGNYITGININNAPGAPSDAQNSAYVLGNSPDAFFPGQPGNVIGFGPTVQLNRHSRLLKPGDHSKGTEYNAQAIQTYTASPTFKVVNNTFWSYTERNTLSSYYYSEIIDPSWFAENRTEFIFTSPKYSINTGLDLRYQRTKAYDDYFFEPANVWDLTQDHNYINVYNAASFYGRFVGQPVPGWPNRYATPGTINGDTNDSHGTTVGPYFQATWKAHEKLDVVTGVRYDYFSADVTDPLFPGQPHDTISVSNPNYNASVVYKPTKTSSVYVTYNYSKNTSGAVGVGGGITGWATDANGNPVTDADGNYYLSQGNFSQPSELWEAGTKYSLRENTLFLNFAVYDQSRTAKSTSSNAIQKFKARGFEAELNYQPSKHLYTTLSYSYIDATVTAPFQSDGGIALLPTQGIDYAHVHEVSGLPKNQMNGLVSYGFDNGLTLTANLTYTTEINNNYAGTLVIPSQYSLDVGAAYKYKMWDFRLNISNVTDEKNWAPPNAVYGNASILALPGTQFQFTAKFNF